MEENRTVISEFEINMDAFYFRVEVEGETHWADDGIGTYEFWGSIGHDSRPYETLEDSLLRVAVIDFYDADGNVMQYSEKDHGHLLQQWEDEKWEKIEEQLLETE